MTNKCEKCETPESEADLEVMPCCGGHLCWDFCLYEEPGKCPLCGASIRVEPKDPFTKEAYVELIPEEEKGEFKITVRCKCGQITETGGETKVIKQSVRPQLIEDSNCIACGRELKVYVAVQNEKNLFDTSKKKNKRL